VADVARLIQMRRIAAAVVASSVASFALPAAAQGILPPPKKEAELPPPTGEIRFVADPVTDGAILSISLGFAALLDLVIGTGELRPQQPGSSDNLLSIDKAVLAKDYADPNAKNVSHVGIAVAGIYAFGDTLFTTVADGPESGLVDLVIYGESASITWAVTDLAKLAVRRPRPGAYRERDRWIEQFQNNNGRPPSADELRSFEPSGTNAALSFFSGHASMTAALSSTATYLAFSRSKTLTRGFITAGAGAIVTTAVCWGRVKGGAHFPTDVIAGAMAGIGIGALVPHLHRETESKPIWIGLGPPGGEGLGLSLNGLF
jgi:membrane-associated phospholipid phosphatase